MSLCHCPCKNYDSQANNLKYFWEGLVFLFSTLAGERPLCQYIFTRMCIWMDCLPDSYELSHYHSTLQLMYQYAESGIPCNLTHHNTRF